MLDAVTGRESAPFVDRAGVRNEVQMEPVTNYLVGRVRRDGRGGSTRFGGVFSMVNRDLSDPALKNRLHSAAYTTGVDVIHEWAGRTWQVASSFSPSRISFAESAPSPAVFSAAATALAAMSRE